MHTRVPKWLTNDGMFLGKAAPGEAKLRYSVVSTARKRARTLDRIRSSTLDTDSVEVSDKKIIRNTFTGQLLSRNAIAHSIEELPEPRLIKQRLRRAEKEPHPHTRETQGQKRATKPQIRKYKAEVIPTKHKCRSTGLKCYSHRMFILILGASST